MSSDLSMGLTVDITGDASSVVSAADQAGRAVSGFEGVSAQAIASLTAAIDRLNLDFEAMGGSAVKSSEGVASVGKSSAVTTGLLKDMNEAGGSAARMFSALGLSAGEATGRVEAFTGVLESMKRLAPEVLAIGAAIGTLGAGFSFLKDGVRDAADMEQSMDRLKAVVDEQGRSWGAASEQIEKYLNVESVASGITRDQLGAALSELAGKIHDVHDAEVILRVAEEEHIATGKSLTEVTNALLEAEAGRGMTLAQLDPRLKTLIRDHADLDTILKVLHADNRDAMNDADGTAMTWSRVGVVFNTIREDIGDRLLPIIDALGTDILGIGADAADMANVAGKSFEVLGNSAKAAWDAFKNPRNIANDVKAIQEAVDSLSGSLGRLQIPLGARGEMVLQDALSQHNASMSSIQLDNNPTVGFSRGSGTSGGKGKGKGKAAKLASWKNNIHGAGEATVLYDNILGNTTKDEDAFTKALYASGIALGEKTQKLLEARDANAERNKEERDTYGKSIGEQIAYYQNELDLLKKYDADNLTEQVRLQNKIDDLQTQAYKKQIDDQQKVHQQQIAEIGKFADEGVALFDSFFTRGKNGMSSFADSFRKMLDGMLADLERSQLTRLLERMFGINPNNPLSVSSSGIFGGGSSGNGVFSLAASPVSSAAIQSGLAAASVANLTGNSTLAQAYIAAGASPADAITMSSGVSSSGGGSSLFLPGGGLNWGAKPFGASGTIGSIAAGAIGGAAIGQYVFGGKGFADLGGAVGGGLGAAYLAAIPGIGIPLAIAAALGGAELGSLFGNHFNPANEPDIYQQDAWGQQNADMTGGEWTANGKQYNPDSWTNQLTKNRGWNIVMESFVSKFRGKTNQLPQSLQAVWSNIESLWGGANGQAEFNHDGKDGFLDIGSGKRAKWSEFWQYVKSYGPAIAQLMDNYQDVNVYNSQNGSASAAGTYSPDGSPYIMHNFPDFPGATTTAPPTAPTAPGVPGVPGGTTRPPIGGGPITGHGASPMDLYSSPVIITQYVSGSVVTQDEVNSAAFRAGGTYARASMIRRLNRPGK